MADLERLAVAMRSSSQAIQRMSFAGQPRDALEFVAYSKPVWTCRQCGREFASRGLVQVKLRQWFVAVASACRRCGGRLTPTRIYTARAIHEIIAASEPYERHAFVCERLARAFDDGRPISAVTRAMKALAAPLPTNPRVFYRARSMDASPTAPAERRRCCGNLSARNSFATKRTATGTGDRPPTDRTSHGPWWVKSPQPLV
jgi:hypothetical protein